MVKEELSLAAADFKDGLGSHPKSVLGPKRHIKKNPNVQTIKEYQRVSKKEFEAEEPCGTLAAKASCVKQSFRRILLLREVLSDCESWAGSRLRHLTSKPMFVKVP